MLVRNRLKIINRSTNVDHFVCVNQFNRLIFKLFNRQIKVLTFSDLTAQYNKKISTFFTRDDKN